MVPYTAFIVVCQLFSTIANKRVIKMLQNIKSLNEMLSGQSVCKFRYTKDECLNYRLVLQTFILFHHTQYNTYNKIDTLTTVYIVTLFTNKVSLLQIDKCRSCITHVDNRSTSVAVNTDLVLLPTPPQPPKR